MTLVQNNSPEQINASLISLIKELEELRHDLEDLKKKVHTMGQIQQ